MVNEVDEEDEYCFRQKFLQNSQKVLKKVTNVSVLGLVTNLRPQIQCHKFLLKYSFIYSQTFPCWLAPTPLFCPIFQINSLEFYTSLFLSEKKEKSTNEKRVEMIRRKSILYLGSCDSTPPASSVQPTSWPTVDIRYISIQCFWR